MAVSAEWARPDLRGRVACVTGASYGAGRGISEALGHCGATVYVTGRSTSQRPTLNRAWTVESTAALVSAAGGQGVAVRVDHSDDRQVQALFDRIAAEQGKLDLLVSNVWQWGPRERYEAPTWEQPIERWDAMIGVGLRSCFTTVRSAIRMMLDSGSGLIVLTQERPGDHVHFGQNLIVDVAAKAAQRMTEFLAHELDGRVVAVLVCFGWLRSVNRGMGFDPESVGMTEDEFTRQTESPQFVGRAIASLAHDREAHSRINGRTLQTAAIAAEYGFTDVDDRTRPGDNTPT